MPACPAAPGRHVRVRFAPSPTGLLHVGGARTALFNWLLARRHGGAFLVRIEDTDRQRSRPEHVNAILDGLEWLGLDWDEEPVFQAAAADRHRGLALRLLDQGAAYRDFTPPDEYAREREAAVASGAGAVGRLPRTLAARWPAAERDRLVAGGAPFAVRFRVPDGETAWRDLVHGPMRFDNQEIEDFVILRSDGTPTYNLAVVADDAAMNVTHVVRGSDHVSNTPKQVLLCRAAGEAVPKFGHLPLILGPDGSRLSKRHGAESVQAYRREGILPAALVNFLALLGWSPGTDDELLAPEELVGLFSLERVLKKGAVFDSKKLRWLNRQHMARMTPAKLAAALAPVLEAELEREAQAAPTEQSSAGAPADVSDDRPDAAAVPGAAAPQVAPSAGWRTPSGLPGKGDLAPDSLVLGPGTDSAPLRRLAEVLAPRSSSFREMAVLARPYVGPVRAFDPKAARRAWGRDAERAAAILEAARASLAETAWDAAALEASLRALAGELGVGAGKVFQPLRVALTGVGATPGIFDVLLIVGRKTSLQRIDHAILVVRAGARTASPQ